MANQHKVYINRTFPCSAHQLYPWLTEPDRFSQWFGPPGSVVTEAVMEVHVGGFYTIVLERNSRPFFTMNGSYIAVDSPNLLEFSINYEGLSPTPPASRVCIILEQVTTQETHLQLIQSFELEPQDMAQRTQAWEHMFTQLSLLLT